jgi:hypothetical protein
MGLPTMSQHFSEHYFRDAGDFCLADARQELTMSPRPCSSGSGGSLDRDRDFAMKLLDESYLVRPEMLCMFDLGGCVRVCECIGKQTYLSTSNG